MKSVLPIVGVALALSLSGTAYAADHDRGGRGDRGRDNHATHQNNGNNNGQRFDRQRGPQRAPVVQQQQRAPVVQQQRQRQWQSGQRNDNNRWRNNDRQRGPVVNTNNYRPPVNNWRNQNARSNWQQYRRNYELPRRYRVGVYHGPRNFQYRRWSYGERLPSAYYARSFWLLNAISYGLFSPPSGLIWVRYGDDALLVDQYTGEIVQVRYDVFY